MKASYGKLTGKVFPEALYRILLERKKSKAKAFM